MAGRLPPGGPGACGRPTPAVHRKLAVPTIAPTPAPLPTMCAASPWRRARPPPSRAHGRAPAQPARCGGSAVVQQVVEMTTLRRRRRRGGIPATQGQERAGDGRKPRRRRVVLRRLANWLQRRHQLRAHRRAGRGRQGPVRGPRGQGRVRAGRRQHRRRVQAAGGRVGGWPGRLDILVSDSAPPRARRPPPSPTRPTPPARQNAGFTKYIDFADLDSVTEDDWHELMSATVVAAPLWRGFLTGVNEPAFGCSAASSMSAAHSTVPLRERRRHDHQPRLAVWNQPLLLSVRVWCHEGGLRADPHDVASFYLASVNCIAP